MEPFRENNREKQVKFIGVPEIDKESRLRNRKRKPRVVMMEEIAERNVPDFLGKYTDRYNDLHTAVSQTFVISSSLPSPCASYT